MAIRTPLVIISGQIQQLPSGDTVASSPYVTNRTNNNAGPIVIGTPVYADAADDVDKAQADAEATSECIGLVYDTSIASAASGGICTGGILTATTGEWDAVTGLTGGLNVDNKYYLSAATAGLLTETAPTTTTEYVKCIGIALSTTDMLLVNREKVLL